MLRLGPDYPEAWFELGNLYDGLGQPDSAEAMYREAIRRRPDYAAAYQNLGILYFVQENPEAAELQFLKAIELQPAYVEAYQNLGILYYSQGREAEAERQFLEALRIDPEFGPAYINLGFLYGQQEQWEKMDVLVRESPFVTADKIQLLYQLGYELLQYEASGPALQAFRLAIELDASEPMSYYWLCTYHTLLGDEAAALAALEESLEKARAADQDYYELASTDEDLAPLRQTERYKELMNRFFPGR